MKSSRSPAHRLLAALILVLALSVSGCATHRPASATVNGAAPTLAGDPAHPGRTQGWVDTKLYFGLGPANPPEQGTSSQPQATSHQQQGTSESTWRAFLDREVTPRFPDGLSVSDVYGQWKGKDQTAPERLRSKVLIIDYPDTQENRDKIDAIRAAWKQLTGEHSVLRVTAPADVSF